MCYLLVDFRHLRLYSLFAFLLARIYIGKFNLDFVVVWNFSLLLLCFSQMWVGVMLLRSTSDIVPVFLAPLDLVSGFSDSYLYFGLILVAVTFWRSC